MDYCSRVTEHGVMKIPFSLQLTSISLLHQSIPAVPIPPPPRPLAGHLLMFQSWGWGHLKFYHCPGVGHLPTPGTTPGHLTSLSGFGLACNIWILKVSKMITFVKIFYDFGRFMIRIMRFQFLDNLIYLSIC